MSATDGTAPARLVARLQRRALTLGVANSFDYAMQFLLPVVLVRFLSRQDFGEYRLLWLAVSTVLAIAPLSLPQSLYFFLPRAEPAARARYVRQTLLYMALAGLAGACVVSGLNPWQPKAIAGLNRFDPVLPLLILLWVTASLLDILPTIEERVRWQAAVTIGLASLRALALGLAAWLTGALAPVLWTLLGLAAFKLCLLAGYIVRQHGLRGRWLAWDEFAPQFRHAAPFGLSSALFSVRHQADQWVAASLFSVHRFAAFSIAAVLAPIINLFRLSVNHAFLPSMSKLHANGDVAAMLDLNSRANVLVGRMVYPLLAFAFVFADDLITLVYTAEYIEAATVMRVYVGSLAAMVVEVFSLTLLLKEGHFALRLNVLMVLLSASLSWLGAHLVGLPGAALGSVSVLYIDRLATLWRLSTRLAIPIRRLQDWATLAQLIGLAAFAGLAAWWATHFLPVDALPVVRMAVGGSVLAAVYLLLHGVLLPGSSTLAVLDGKG